MIDTTSREPLRVQTDPVAGPYFMVPESQIADVRRLLDRHGVRYWVDNDVFSVDNGPYIAVVNLGFYGDAEQVQRILDEEG